MFEDILNSPEFFEALQAGHAEAYAQLMYYGWRILRPKYRIKGLWNIAEDSFSITLKKLWATKCADYRPARGRFVTWFVTVAIRDALNERRREENIRKKAEAKRHEKSSGESYEEGETSGPRKLDVVARLAFNSLSNNDQIILALRFIDGLEIDVIAQNLSISKTAVRMRVIRASARFAEAVERLADFEVPKRPKRSRRRNTGRALQASRKYRRHISSI